MLPDLSPTFREDASIVVEACMLREILSQLSHLALRLLLSVRTCGEELAGGTYNLASSEF